MQSTEQNDDCSLGASGRSRIGRPLPQSLALMLKYYSVCIGQSVIELSIYSFGQMLVAEHFANTFAVLFAACFQFFMNRNVTFKSSSNLARSLALFVLLWIWNYCFSTTMITLLPGMLGVHSIFIKLGTMICQGLWGFFLSRYVIFK